MQPSRRRARAARSTRMRLIRFRSRPAMTDERSTDFGFQRVPRADKARRVRGVFDSVADHYDLMNDLMSAGAHRIWKRFTLALANLRPGARALDVAGGSGDLAAGLARQVGERGLVVLTDINAAMLRRGRDRLIDAGCAGNVEYVQADAESLPFPDGSFDCITIGFGLRNVTDKGAALTAMRRACSHCTTPIRFAFCRCSASWWRATRRVTAIWPSRSACIRTRRLL